MEWFYKLLKTMRLILKSALFAIVIVLVLGVGAATLFLAHLQRSALSFPLVYFGQESIGLRSRAEVEQFFQSRADTFTSTPVSIVWRGETKKFLPSELGITLDMHGSINNIEFVHSANNLRFILSALRPMKAPVFFSIDEEILDEAIEKNFSHYVSVHGAYFSYDTAKKSIIVVPEQEGFIFDRDHFITQLSGSVGSLTPEAFFLRSTHVKPILLVSDLEPRLAELAATLPGKITFGYERASWTIDFPRDISMLRWKKEGEVFSYYFDESAVRGFLKSSGIRDSVERKTENVTIYRTDKGKVAFEGRGVVGRNIDEDRLIEMLNAASDTTFELPVVVEEPIINAPRDLRARGIKELVTTGYTTYYGSPKNRIHNIAIGVAHIDGTILLPGETFSFNENLGVVDASTGYREELVIKPDGTKPEFGGGLCQVSTTMYRAALNAGLPIVERKPHSYVVSYYAQVGGHGLDATIYPGSADLRFLNDTGSALLVQGYVDGLSATFNLYGTKDGRTSRLEGPYIANHTKAPPDEIIYTIVLPDGERKQEEKPHDGFDATWYRILNKDGVEVRETIFSRYRAIPARILVGGKAPEEDLDEHEKEVIDEARAFE